MPVTNGVYNVVADFGAVGDGTTDDTTAIQNAIDAAGTSFDGHGVVYFEPNKTYRVTDTLTAPYDHHTWQMYGATLLVDHDGIGVIFGEETARHSNIQVYGGFINHIIEETWPEGSTGVLFWNTQYSAYHDFYIEGFERGLECRGGGHTDGGGGHHPQSLGNQYFTGVPRSINACKFPLYLVAREGGWCNEHTFLGGGRLGYRSIDPNAAGGYCVKIDRESTASYGATNNHRFFGICFESGKSTGLPSGAVYLNGNRCLFDGCRYELINFGTGPGSTPFINNVGDGAVSDLGVNIFVGGVNLDAPEYNLVTPSNPGYCFHGNVATRVQGGKSDAPLITWRDTNDGTQVIHRVVTPAGAVTYELTGVGVLKLGASAAGIFDGSNANQINFSGRNFNLQTGTAAASNALSYCRPGGILFQDYTTAGTSGTSETDLFSHSLAANALSADGQKIEVEIAGNSKMSNSPTTTTRNIKLYFNNTVILQTNAISLTVGDSTWEVSATIIRTGSSTARAFAKFTQLQGTSLIAPGAMLTITDLTGITWSGGVPLKITGTTAGTSPAANDIAAKLGVVKWFPVV